MKSYNKLVRDKIPDRIAAKGEPYKMHIASAEEYMVKLREKLIEEATECAQSASAEELADLLEVIYAVAEELDITPLELEKLRQKKLRERGAFRKRIILEES